MAPADRRAAVIAATIPLLRAHGVGVTTRQIADAAGVAEGTIFSVFDDKESLVAAALEAALAPDASLERLAAVDPSQPLEARVGEIVAIVQAYVASTWELLAAVARSGGAARRPPGRPDQASDRLAAAVADHLAPDSSQFRLPVADTARALVALTVGCSHPTIIEAPMSPDRIVELFFDGVRGGRSR
jgi:AcrR family transcriptional regulator